MKLAIRKKHTKRLIGVGVFFILLLFVANYLVRHNMEKIIQSLVASESNGKYKLEIQKIKFQGHLKKIKAYQAHLYVMDTASQQSKTDVQFPFIEFQVKSIWDIILHKKLQLDYVICDAPTFNIRPLEKDTRGKISLPKQLGELYIQIEKVMNVMQVAKTRFTNSRLNLFLPGDSTKVIRLAGIDFGVDGFGTNKGTHEAGRFFFSENIFLHSGPQSISFPDGLHRLDFNGLHISTDHKMVNIYQCTLTGQSPDCVSGNYNIYFDTLRLIQTDFQALYNHALIKVDSIYCKNSKLNFLFASANRDKKLSTDSLINPFIKNLFGDIAVNYIGILNSDISLKSVRDNKILTFFSKGNDFQLRQIKIETAGKQPVQVGSINFNVKNYRSYTYDSLYEISFDSVSLTSNELFLSNFGLVPGVKNNNHALRALYIPNLALSGLSLGELIFDNQIKLDKATLLRPTLVIESKGGKENKIKKPLFDLFNEIEQYFNVQKLAIKDGHVTYDFSDGDNHSLVFENVNSEIFLKYLLQATQINSLEASIDQLSFSKAVYNNGLQQLQLLNGMLDGDQRDFIISNFEYRDKKELLQMQASGLLLSGININDDADEEEIFLQKLAWRQGKINSIVLPRKNESEKKYLPFSIQVGNISMPQTDVRLNLPNDFQLQTYMQHLDIFGLSKPADAGIHFEKAFFDGGSLSLKSPQLSIQTDTFNIQNIANSFLRNVSVAYRKGKDQVAVKIPYMGGMPGITNFENVRHWFGFHLYKPEIHWTIRPVDDTIIQAKQTKKNEPFVFEDLLMDSAHFIIEKINGEDTMRLNLPSTNIDLRYASFSDSLFMHGIKLSLLGIAFQPGKALAIRAPQAHINLVLDTLLHLPGQKFSMQSKPFHFSAPSIQISGKKEMLLKDAVIDIPGFVISETDLTKPMEFITHTSNATFQFSTALHNGDGKFEFHHITASLKDSLLKIDSLAFVPDIKSDAFFASQKTQSDFINLNTGKILFQQMDFSRLLTKPFPIHAGFVKINDAVLEIMKDKKLPMPKDSLKLLPTAMLRKIKLPLHIDSARVENAKVAYTELPAKHDPLLQVEIDNINALLKNVKNDGFERIDSLGIWATGKLGKAIPLQLEMHQAYIDTAAGFRMNVRVPAFDVSAINELQRPFTKIQLTQGNIGPIALHAKGNNLHATGDLQMQTKNIRIQAYREKNAPKTPLFTRFKYFIANNFILKKEKTRTGTFTLERVQSRSVFNYWVKMMLAGIKSAAGMNKKKK